MDVEYELTQDDFYAFQWRGAFGSPRGRRSRRTVYILWLVALLLFAILPAIGADGFTISRVNFGFVLVAYPIVALAQWWWERWLLRRTILGLLRDEKPDRGQLGVHRLVLDEEGVLERTAVGESRTAWAGIHRVEQDDRYIYLYTSSAAAHVIPKRAFADPRDAEEFYQLSHRRATAAA
jgi:hypothetical protein